MADEIRVNRNPQMQPQGMPKQDMQMQNDSMMMNQKNSKAPWMILAVVVIVIVVLGVLFRSKLFMGKTMTADGYQAVFLTNGQVYFGKMSAGSENYADLKDIYYLQVGPQQGSGQQAQAQQSISLVKLGNELHGPVDEMHISRTQILFYEDLKSDGSVVKAIQQYKANPQGATPTPSGQVPAAITPVK
jgi:hypothetical protein